MEEREVVNEDAMDRGVCEMRQIYGDIAGRKDERQWSDSYPIHAKIKYMRNNWN
jgi:hypothetical protein